MGASNSGLFEKINNAAAEKMAGRKYPQSLWSTVNPAATPNFNLWATPSPNLWNMPFNCPITNHAHTELYRTIWNATRSQKIDWLELDPSEYIPWFTPDFN